MHISLGYKYQSDKLAGLVSDSNLSPGVSEPPRGSRTSVKGQEDLTNIYISHYVCHLNNN